MNKFSELLPMAYLVNDVAKSLRRRFDDEAKVHDLTLPQWRTIAQLARTDGLPQVALAKLVETDPMTLSGIIERLEAKGLAERIQDPSDSRAKLVQSTAKSRALVEEMEQVATQLYGTMVAGISEKDQQIVTAALTRMSENLATGADCAKDK